MATDPEDLDHSTVDPANQALGDQYHAVVPQMIGRIRQTPDTGWDRPSSNRAAAPA